MPYATFLDETLEVFGASYQDRVVYDDNLIDRLNHYYTNIMLFIFVVVVGTPELVGYYIECWCPPDFEESQVDYVNYLCWISNTYYIPMTKPIPQSYEMRYSNRIYYYQWTPLIFLVMAVLFKIPRTIWKYLSNRCGLGIKKFITTAKDTQSQMLFNLRRAYQINLFNAGAPPMAQTEFFPPGVDIETERQKTLKYLAIHMDHWCHIANSNRAGILCNTRRRVHELFDFGCGRHHGNFLICLLLFVRVLYVINVIGQLVLLNEFLTDDFYVYGYDVIANFLAGKDWSLNHARFPRITLCDFDMRQLSNIQRFTLQCVLPINLYNEKIFIVLWFWFTFIAVITIMNLAYTVVMALWTKSRESYIIKYLKLNGIYKENDPKIRKLTNLFIYTHLKFDGVFIVQMLSNNAGSAITADVVNHLWKEFLARYHESESGNGVETHSFLSSAASLRCIENSLYPSCSQSVITQRASPGNIFKNTNCASSWNNPTQQSVPRNAFVSVRKKGYFISTENKLMMPSETLV